MKTSIMKAKLILSAYIFFVISLLSSTATAQTKKQLREKARAAEVQKLLESRRFSFKAQSVQPMRGGTINLTSNYDLTIKKDTIQSYLPYYGRAYSAPLNPTESPLTFNSTNFTYTEVNGKKGSKEITIELKDQSLNVRKFYLSVSAQGYATLQTINTNRDPISFNGYISAIK